jgi:hypothetical protein
MKKKKTKEKNQQEEKKLMKKKKYELTELTLQLRLTRQIWDSRHESLITKKKKKLTG